MESFLFCHRLGHGGMAETFLALQRGIGGFEKLVVVKRMHAHLRYDAELVRLFVNEAKLAASIRHPNVVQMLNLRRNERELFIVMEYLSGESLQELLAELRRRRVSMPISIACRIGADIAAGLHAGHSVSIGGKPRPVIHRDVTPSNILVGYDGLSRMLDFGIARGVSNDRAHQTTQRGKLGYIAPEQLSSGHADERSDIWQLGSVLYEMVTGERLYDANNLPALRTQMRSSIEPLKRRRDDVPGLLDATIRSALDPDPSNRPVNARELRESLLHIGTADERDDETSDVSKWLSRTVPDLHQVRQNLEQRASAGESDDASLEILSTLIPDHGTRVSKIELPDSVRQAGEPRHLSPLVLAAIVAILALMFGTVIAVQRFNRPPPLTLGDVADQATRRTPPSGEESKLDPEQPGTK